MHRDVVEWLVCPACGGERLTVQALRSDADEVLDGAVRCGDCDAWWRVEDGILDLLLPPVCHEERRRAFASRYGLLNLDLPGTGAAAPSGHEALRRQIDFFTGDSEHYERDVTRSPYFMALDDVAFEPWVAAHAPAGANVLEVGAGTGRQCVRVAAHGGRVLGVDISEEMLRVARRVACDRGVVPRIDLVVADAGALPCRVGAFDAALAVGTLHHVPDPASVVRGIGRSLKDGAPVFTYDPHNSPVRFIFDAMMRWWKLYDEEASDDPLIDAHDILGWMEAASISGRARISTYLPPHLFHLLPPYVNRALLRSTDGVFGAIPGLRTWGGMLIFEGRKAAAAEGRS